MLDQYNSEWLEALKTDESTLEHRSENRLYAFYYGLYLEEIQEWNWDDIKTELKDYAELDDDSELRGILRLGSVFSIMPSGKYYTFWANSNVDKLEHIQDRAYYDAMEKCAEYNNMYITSGEGDPCDIFIGCLLDIVTVDDIPDFIHQYSVDFIFDSQDIESVAEHIGIDKSEYDSFFVCAGGGDYIAIWGMVGIVPYSGKHVERLV